jgi:addiction module RelE/StbE family toxin
MKQYKVELLPAAWQDIDEISDYLIAKNVQAAQRIIDLLMTEMRKLAAMPEARPYVRNEGLRRQGYRVLVCEKYLCIYKIVGDTVFIHHVVHGARNYPLLFEEGNINSTSTGGRE